MGNVCDSPAGERSEEEPAAALTLTPIREHFGVVAEGVDLSEAETLFVTKAIDGADMPGKYVVKLWFNGVARKEGKKRLRQYQAAYNPALAAYKRSSSMAHFGTAKRVTPGLAPVR